MTAGGKDIYRFAGRFSVDDSFAFVEGESRARSLLERIDRGDAQPGDLGAMLRSLPAGPMADGATRVFEKALEERRRG